jgi:hypothetical protein
MPKGKPYFTFRRGKKLWVGDLGEAIVTNNERDVLVYFIKESDGTKSWQLLPDEMRGDKILETAYVKEKRYFRHKKGLKKVI